MPKYPEAAPMNILRIYWHKICEPLDGFLWRKDISHPIIRPLLRNIILASGACLLLGAACYAVWPWLFWFGMGILCMAWLFWSWARFFLRISIGNYSATFLRSVLFRFCGRLLVLAILLYIALAICRAPVSAILAGLFVGSLLALASFALANRG